MTKKRAKKTVRKSTKSAAKKTTAKQQPSSAKTDTAAGDRQRARSAAYQRLIAAATREIGPVPPVVDPKRRESCRLNLRKYLETYTPRAVRLGWSADHLELIESLQKILIDGGQLAIGMPRGTGKTTIVIRALAWAISYGHHRFGVLVAATDQKAKKALGGLRKEFETNELLLEDFPETCYPVRCLQGIRNRQAGQTSQGNPTAIHWGIDELILPTIAGSVSSGSILLVGGITGAVSRGPQHTLDDGEIIRPSVVLIDDPQTRESAKSPDQVQTRTDILEADIAGMAGPDEGLAMLATVTVIYPDDLADQLLNRDLMPDWNGIRKQFLLSEPDNMHLWDQYKELRRQSLRTYQDIRLATEFYRKNRKAMDKGASVSWDARYRRKQRKVGRKMVDVREISAIQHAMEWLLVKPDAFASELQNQPNSRINNSKAWLSAKEIETKTHPLGRGIVPQVLIETRRLVEHCDVHDDLLYWAVGAIAENGSAGIIDYGTYPPQKARYFQKSEARLTMQRAHGKLGLDGAIRESLIVHCRNHLDRTWQGEDGHTDYQIDLLLIDCGHKLPVVNAVVLELLRDPAYRGRLMLCRGFGVTASDTPFSDRKFPDGTVTGNACYSPPRKSRNEAPRINIDTNYWKTETHDRWATSPGEPGCLTLFSGGDHQGFAEHQKAEFAVETEGKGRTVFQFKSLPQDNHWFDNTVDLLAGASFRGCDTPANVVPVQEPKRKRRRRRGGLL